MDTELVVNIENRRPLDLNVTADAKKLSPLRLSSLLKPRRSAAVSMNSLVETSRLSLSGE